MRVFLVGALSVVTVFLCSCSGDSAEVEELREQNRLLREQLAAKSAEIGGKEATKAKKPANACKTVVSPWESHQYLKGQEFVYDTNFAGEPEYIRVKVVDVPSPEAAEKATLITEANCAAAKKSDTELLVLKLEATASRRDGWFCPDRWLLESTTQQRTKSRRVGPGWYYCRIIPVGSKESAAVAYRIPSDFKPARLWEKSTHPRGSNPTLLRFR